MWIAANGTRDVPMETMVYVEMIDGESKGPLRADHVVWAHVRRYRVAPLGDATVAPPPDDWILWEGGTPPLKLANVDVKFRNGDIVLNNKVSVWRWHHDGGFSDIVGYRARVAPQLAAYVTPMPAPAPPTSPVPPPMSDGWMEWTGGYFSPLPSDTFCEVRLRNGTVTCGTSWNWSYHGGPGDIIAYREVQRPVQVPSMPPVPSPYDVLKNENDELRAKLTTVKALTDERNALKERLGNVADWEVREKKLAKLERQMIDNTELLRLEMERGNDMADRLEQLRKDKAHLCQFAEIASREMARIVGQMAKINIAQARGHLPMLTQELLDEWSK